MSCTHSTFAAYASLFWPLCGILLFVVLLAIVDGRHHRQKLRDATRRADRLERRLELLRAAALHLKK